MAMNSMNYSLCAFYVADDAMRRGGGGGVADWNYEARCMYGGAVESSGSGSGSSSDDILALLPSDPFGMEELSNSLSAAFYGLIDDLDDDIDADLDYYWSQALAYSSSEPSDCSWVETDIPGLLLPCMDDLPGWFCSSWMREGFQGVAGASSSVTVNDGEEAECSGGGIGLPHEALPFALGYLDLMDLFSVEMVCKTLRATVQGDPLLWRRIHLDTPLNKRITDDDLLRLTDRAQGSLECLSLHECTNITDEGLKNVLESNLKLKKLGVDGCVRLTVVGLISNLKIFNSLAVSKINYLKLGNFNVSPGQFEELRLLIDGEELARPTRPNYYHERIHHIQPSDGDLWMDIELCPMCQQHRPVFDCPLESCRAKKTEPCRGCETCIFRCLQCGRCIVGDCVYVETFFLQYLCGDCWRDGPPIPEPQEE